MTKLAAGQSLTEYGLIGIAILLASVAGLTLLGQNLNTAYLAMFTGYQKQTPSLGAISHSAPGGAGSVQLVHHATVDGTKTVTLPNGKALLITTTDQDLQTALQVDGANGVTTILATQLQAMAEQLLATGDISDEQAGLFNELSNQGHRMAQIEKLVENAYRNNQSTITFEGQSYTPIQLTGKIGWVGKGVGAALLESPDDLIKNAPEARSVELAALIHKYQVLKDSGGLKNPAVQALVGKLTSEIGSISETLESVASNKEWDFTSPPLHEQVASSLSHIKSAQICTTGDSKDSGTECR